MKPDATTYPARANAEQGGANPDVTTYPGRPNADARALHGEYLALEREGKVWRYVDNDGTTHPAGEPFVIWRPVVEAQAPVASAPAAKADDEGEPQ